MTCQTWASSSHFRHPWLDASVSKRKRCETPVDDLDEAIVAKRRRQCSTLEHGFAYLSIGNPTTVDVPWSYESRSSPSVNFSAMDSDMLPPQPAYTVEEPTVPEVNMKASSWYELEPDRIVITDLDLFTESDDEREREREESVNINPIFLDRIRNKELSKNSPHPKATSTALVLFKPLPGLEQLQREGVTQAKAVDENAMDLEP